jgi:hypothetical protein
MQGLRVIAGQSRGNFGQSVLLVHAGHCQRKRHPIQGRAANLSGGRIVAREAATPQSGARQAAAWPERLIWIIFSVSCVGTIGARRIGG